MGAFPRPGGDISPLYVIFELANEGEEAIPLSRAYVTRKGVVFAEGLEGERALPMALEPGGSFRLWTRARGLAQRLSEAGHGATPRLAFVVEDATGRAYQKSFRFRAGEYLSLEDE